jgi:DNA-binding MarR family transcriptional regulator
MDKEDLHILRLMGEIDRRGTPTQRELSQSLNLSLGLVNSFIKRLVNKGYFKVKAMPRNRAKYLLTPEGVARKSKLTIEYLKYSVNFHKEIKELLINRFNHMKRRQVNSILFFGAGEVAELAYLYLQITEIKLVGIIDESQNGKDFFCLRIDNFHRLNQKDWDIILLTRLDDTDRDINCLVENGVNPKRIMTL